VTCGTVRGRDDNLDFIPIVLEAILMFSRIHRVAFRTPNYSVHIIRGTFSLDTLLSSFVLFKPLPD